MGNCAMPMPLQISIHIEFYNGIVRAVSLPQHDFLASIYLQTAANYRPNNDKY